MIAANGILTARGGVSSHAALVARQMGKICVCGAADVQINYAKRTMMIGSLNFKEGDFLSIDGTTGEIFPGEVKTAPSEVVKGLLENKAAAKRSRTYKNFTQIMAWCAKATKMQVRTNADTPGQVKNAVAFGATGIGLCRTEHMFFEGARIDAVRQMILAETEATGAKLSRNCCRISARISRAASRRSTGCQAPSACSTRRCMNSCRTTASRLATWPRSSR